MIWLNRANKWITSPKHKTGGSQKKILGSTHTDTVYYDKQDKRDSGKLKVSGEKHSPSMKDIHPKK
jgi:hypothetical protein